jgi:hypothetical protein
MPKQTVVINCASTWRCILHLPQISTPTATTFLDHIIPALERSQCARLMAPTSLTWRWNLSSIFTNSCCPFDHSRGHRIQWQSHMPSAKQCLLAPSNSQTFWIFGLLDMHQTLHRPPIPTLWHHILDQMNLAAHYECRHCFPQYIHIW